jgi:hypothetical protein
MTDLEKVQFEETSDSEGFQGLIMSSYGPVSSMGQVPSAREGTEGAEPMF